MIKKIFYLLSLLIIVFPAYTQKIKQERAIPRIDQLALLTYQQFYYLVHV